MHSMGHTDKNIAEINNIPLFFIVGRARSGTSLLRVLLDAHPNILIPFECPFILHMHSKYSKITNWDKDTMCSFYKDLISEPAFNYLNANKNLKEYLIHNAGNHSYAEICKIVYGHCLSVNQKNEITLLGDKNPSYSLKLPFLTKLFPQSKFIHITRDHRDNILSMKNVDFESRCTSSLAYRWKFYNNRIRKAKDKFPEKFYSLRYEDLVEFPEKYLREICNFIGIEYCSEMLQFYTNKANYYSVYPEEALDKYHSHLFQPVSSDHIYTWKKKMREGDVRKADAIVGKAAEMFGYKRKYKKTNPFIYFLCLPGIIYGRTYFLFDDLINALPYKIKIRVFHFLAKLFKPYWKRYSFKKRDTE
jgi:hypothetical protein